MCSLRVLTVCSDVVKGRTGLILSVSDSIVMNIGIHSNFEYLKHDSLEIVVEQDF
jgi:hypothetical protein